MAREIKFRGKLIKNSSWIYGDLVRDNKGHSYIYPEDAEGLYLSNRVDPETVGQYIGLRDIDGEEIFDGDIVRFIDSGTRVIITWHEYLAMFYFQFNKDRPQNINDDKASIGEMKREYALEVIGNIHDNPELLWGEEA